MVLKEVNGPENQERKEEAKKRYDLLKDKSKKYVVERLEKELHKETVDEMVHRASNLSVYRKIIEKKARVYAEGVTRQVGEEYQGQLDLLTDLLNIDTNMKKVNKALEAQKNCMAQIVPYEDPLTGGMKLKFNVLHPFLYDVIEDFDNPELPRVVIFSYWSSPIVNRSQALGTYGGVRSVSPRHDYDFQEKNDGKDQIIADADDNKECQYFVWWSSKYHFTTDEDGQIIQGLQGDDLANPIGMLPFINFAHNQDGEFWAQGGDDLVDGAILVNILLTDLYHIAKVQGMGLFYLFGKNMPETIKVGPNTALTMEIQDGDPVPQIGFASSNPPLQQHMDLIQKYMSFLLSTNNLDATTIEQGLSASNAVSGIQELIRKAEVTQSIEDQREMFRDKEPLLFKIIYRWMSVLFERGVLDPEFAALGTIPEEEIPVLKFPPSQEFMTEEQKLNIIEKRRDLGLDTMVDALMKDNPDMNREDAEAKLLEIMEEKLMNQRAFLLGREEEEPEDGGQGDVQDALEEE